MNLPPMHGDRPFVFLNLAMTADGKIASANRAVTSLGTPRDHEHLYELRAEADALLCGARTVSEQGVTLGTGGRRFEELRRRHRRRAALLRVIVTGSARVSGEAPVFRDRSLPIVALVQGNAPKRRVARLRALADEVRSFGTRQINLAAALRWLRRVHGVRRLLCEGGAELNDSLFRAGVVDEVHVTLCPKIMGGRDASTLVEGIGAGKLADATRLRPRSARRIGDELFLVFSVVRQGR